MTGRNRFAAVLGDEPAMPDPEPAMPAPVPAMPARPPVPREEERTLSARVPDSIFREFARRRTDAEEHLGVRRVTGEVGMEALVRLLRDPAILAAWHAEVQAVRGQER